MNNSSESVRISNGFHFGVVFGLAIIQRSDRTCLVCCWASAAWRRRTTPAASHVIGYLAWINRGE